MRTTKQNTAATPTAPAAPQPVPAAVSRLAIARRLGLIALAYAVTLKLALFFPDAKGILASVWPPGGVALAVLLLAPRPQWRTILATILITGTSVNLLSGRPVLTSVGFMVANVLESWGCAWLITRYCGGGRVTFARVRDVLALGACAVAVNSATALLGAAVAVAFSATPFQEFYLTWWIADGLGILLVTPLIVVCRQPWRRVAPGRWPRVLEAAVLVLVGCAFSWAGFMGTAADLAVVPRPYWLFIPLVWAALRFGTRGTTALLALLAGIVVSLTATDTGVFPLGGNSPAAHLQMVQLFLGVFSLTGMILAAVVSERRMAETELRRINRALQLISQLNQELVRITDEQVLLQAVCRQAVELGGYSMAWVGFAERDAAKTVRPVAQSGFHEGYLNVAHITWSDTDARRGPAGTAICTGQCVVVHNTSTDPAYGHWREAAAQRGFSSCISLPLKDAETSFGALTLYAREPDAFDAEEIRLLGDLAGDLAYGICALRQRAERTREAEAARQSDQKYKQLVETTRTGYVIVDDQGRIVDANPEYVRLTGRACLDEILGHSVLDWTAPHDRERNERAMRRCLAEGLIRDLELDYLTPAGQIITIEIDATVLRAAGQVHVLTLCRDITERKKTEERDRLARDVLQRLNHPGGTADMIRDVLQMIKQHTGLSAVAIRLREGDDLPYFVQTGFSTAFLSTENSLVVRDQEGGVCRDEDGRICLACTCGLVLSGKTDPSNPLFTEGGSFWTNDARRLLDIPPGQDPRLHPRNRCIRDGYQSFALIPLQSGEQIIGLLQLNDHRRDQFTPAMIRYFERLGVSITIALSRQREESLVRDSETRFRKVFDDGPLGMAFVKDAGSRFMRANAAFCQMLGYTEEELQRLTFADVTAPEHRARDAEAVKRLWEGRISQYKAEKRYLKKNGETFWGMLILTLLHSGEGRPLYYLSMIEDISERKHAEEEKAKLQGQLMQAQKMESVGRLAGGVAHDFNNMLMGIMGYVQLCREKIEPGHPICEWLDEVMAGAKRATDLTHQLLAFARKQTITPRIMDLNAAIANMLKLLQRLIGEDIAVTWRPGAAIWPVKMDQSQFDQVMTNLAINARDAINGVGSITIETATTTLDQTYCATHAGLIPGDYVVITFSDTGCGMDEVTLEHLFEPFFTTKEVGRGTGLGLATVHGIVKQLGGMITVESKPWLGTRFTIYWPRCPDPVAVPAVIETDVPSQGGSQSILLVEDDQSVRAITQRFLTDLGYTLLVAESPEEALRLSGQHAGAIHLLITDVVMPHMNGRDLARRLCALRPSLKCLFISGFTADVLAERGILDEHMHLLSKPFLRETLAAKVREVLNA